MVRLITKIVLILAIMLPGTLALAQNKGNDAASDDAGKREMWFKEMKAKKHEFLTRELELTPEQSEAFFVIYDNMDRDLRRISHDTRRMEKAVNNNPNATDAEYDALIEALYSQRYNEWIIESQAKEKFAKILTKKQLANLKRAESDFTKVLMKQHRQKSK